MTETDAYAEPLGDSAIIVRWVGLPESQLVERLRAALAALNRELSHHQFSVVPAFSSVTVYYDCRKLDYRDAHDLVLGVVRKAKSLPLEAARIIEIPVCYDLDLAPDLEYVANHCRMPIEDVVALHSSAEYVVRMIGFSPGFPYLAGLPKAIHCPRKASPRPRVSPGDVAIGGTQTGIYPQATPGGWNIIGRTPVVLFDPARTNPCLLSAGDQVRFRSIDRRTFEGWKTVECE